MQVPGHPAKRALIVDDDPVLRLLTGQALVSMGFEVEEAEDGQMGLDVLVRVLPDLIVLDVEMPGLNGFEICKRIRQNERAKDIPVLIVTGRAARDTIELAFESGANDFIEKPLDWQLLVHRVRFMMRASEAFIALRKALGELRESEKRLAYAQRLARLGHWEWLADDCEMLWSPEVYRIFGTEPHAAMSTYDNWLERVHPDDRTTVVRTLVDSLEQSKPFSLDYRIITLSGEERVVHQHGEVERGGAGAPERIIGTVQDITERRKAEDEIRSLAFYDSLTGLPNRRMLNEWLNRALESARRRDKLLAILFIDLDEFKRINDTLGHLVGDELLKIVADRLVPHVRMSDHIWIGGGTDTAAVSRLGGDEFTVILNSVRSERDVSVAAHRILDVLRKPINVGGHELIVTASMGAALFPQDGEDAETLFRNADSAMYYAKAAGKGRYQAFSERMNEKAKRSLRMEAGLLAAVKREDLTLAYQPIECCRTGAITGIEALARWRTEEFGEVAPSEFIPLAEATGLITSIGELVLRNALTELRSWDRTGLPRLNLAVNISSHQIKAPGFVELVGQVLRETEIDPGRLELEVTESALIGDDRNASEVLGGLKGLGVRVSLDDFGTGYSSLSHLVKFPIDRLKIDRTFVAQLGTEVGGQTAAIVRALLGMAHALGIRVTAEGVETEAQAEYLRAAGCDAIQGFRISAALAARELVDLVRRRASG